MIKIIASVIAGIFTLIGVFVTNSTEHLPLVMNIDQSQNKVITDSHDTVIINTRKITKIDNAENVIIK